VSTTYGDLFDHLEATLSRCPCDHTFRHTQAFAGANAVHYEKLSQTLGDCGGYCDCEVLFNASVRIPNGKVIGDEVITPWRLAEGYYCHSRVDGVPVSRKEAFAAREAGSGGVEFGLRCGKDDPHAELDEKRACAELEDQGGAE
jgi:Protein of unknown function (DUF2695)